MNIGELDRRVSIYTVTTTANNYGELTRAYNLFRSVWAAIEWKGGSEKQDQSDKITGMTKIHIYIRKVINQIDGRKGILEIICELKD